MTDLAFHALAAKVHAAATAADLSFIFCNETHALAPYRQAALVGFFGARRTRLAGHSGLADVDANSPYALWLADVANHLRPQLDALPAAARVMAVGPALLPPALAAAWADWLPDHVWVLSLAGPDGRSRAALFLGRDTPWPADFDAGAPEYLLLQAALLYGHAWWAMARSLAQASKSPAMCSSRSVCKRAKRSPGHAAKTPTLSSPLATPARSINVCSTPPAR